MHNTFLGHLENVYCRMEFCLYITLNLKVVKGKEISHFALKLKLQKFNNPLK